MCVQMWIAKYLKLPSFREWVFPTAEEGNSEKGKKKISISQLLAVQLVASAGTDNTYFLALEREFSYLSLVFWTYLLYNLIVLVKRELDEAKCHKKSIFSDWFFMFRQWVELFLKS